jgi:outer membrane biosynthesis protein TonB
MIKVRDTAHPLHALYLLNEKHPYLFSFILSCVISLFVLFWSPSLESARDQVMPFENIQFIDIETAESPKRIVKKELSTSDSDPVEASDTERAMGTSDDPNAVDLSFYPNIAPPKVTGKLKKLYPRSAKDMNIEAIVNVEILISSNGRVLSVNILAIRLTKALPPELHTVITKDFARDARKILLEARFTPPVVEGKNVPVKMEMPIKFRLE